MVRQFLLAIFVLAAICVPAVARQITDAGGRKVDIPERIGRVFPAGPPAAVMVYVVAPEKLLGWHRAPTPKEQEFLLPNARLLPTLDRLTGESGMIRPDVLQNAKPDIIIDVGTVDGEYVALADKVQAETGIPYVLIDGSLSRSAQSLRQVGDLLGVQSRGDELAAFAAARLLALEHDLASVPADERPNVYYGRGPNGLETGAAGSLNVELIDLAGGRNVAAAAGPGELQTVSLDTVRKWNPDIILGTSASFVDDAASDPRWADVAAVRHRRIYQTPTLPFGWIDSPPGINRLIGIPWLTELFYPGRFRTDLRTEVRTFFKLFYQIELAETQIDDLVRSAMPGK